MYHWHFKYFCCCFTNIVTAIIKFCFKEEHLLITHYPRNIFYWVSQAHRPKERSTDLGSRAEGLWRTETVQKLQWNKCHFWNMIYKLVFSQQHSSTGRAFAPFGKPWGCWVFQNSCLSEFSPGSTIYCPFPFLSSKAPAYEDLAARTRLSATDTGNGPWLDWCLHAAEWGHMARP